MKKAKMSVQQRKYFVERISKTINKQILNIRQAQAADIYDVSETHYNKYLSALKVEKVLKEYRKVADKYKLLGSKLNSVFTEVQKTVVNPDATWNETQNNPSVWDSSDWQTFDKAFRWACAETAKQTDSTATHTTIIKNLENKRDKAIDTLHGVDEFADILGSVNNILKGTEVPKLGA